MDYPVDSTGLHPVADLQTDDGVVVFDDRPVVGLRSGLADLLASCAQRHTTFTLVTPPDTRLTFPARSVLTIGGGRWVACDTNGMCWDAVTGAGLLRDGDGFTDDASRPTEPRWRDGSADASSTQLLCTVTVQHPASTRVSLCAVDALCFALTGAQPIGWGAFEPVGQPWDLAAFTTYARHRAPRPSMLVVIGHRFAATVEVTRTATGIQEDVAALVLADTVAEDRAAAAFRVRGALADMSDQMTVAFAVAHLREGRRDLTAPAHSETPPTPTALLIGPRACRAVGLDVVETAPLPRPKRVGRARVPGILFAIDGDHKQSWAAIDAFVRHLGPQRIAQVAPGLL